MKTVTRWLALMLVLAGSGPAGATTWHDKEGTCPVCGKSATYRAIGSYGNYVYRWESRCQFVFWPHTDRNYLFRCPHCHFTAFMDDFHRALSAEKREAVVKALEGVTLPEGDYAAVPMSARLAVAERVYRVLGFDDLEWSEFYRTVGYHLEVEGDAAGSAAARRKALDHAVKALADPAHAARRKELLVVTGTMRSFLGDQAGARADFDRAAALHLLGEDGKVLEGGDRYLSKLIAEHLRGLDSTKPPPADGCRTTCTPECFRPPAKPAVQAPAKAPAP